MFVIRLEDESDGEIEVYKRGDVVYLTYILGNFRKRIVCEREDLDQYLGEEYDYGIVSKIIAKLFNVIETINPDNFDNWMGQVTYFIEYLINYLINPTDELEEFFEQFKDFKYFEISYDGRTISDNTKSIRIYSTSSEFSNLQETLLPYQDNWIL